MSNATDQHFAQQNADREAARREAAGAAGDQTAGPADGEAFIIRRAQLATHITTSSAEAADLAWRHRELLLQIFPAPELVIRCTDHAAATAVTMTFKPVPSA